MGVCSNVLSTIVLGAGLFSAYQSRATPSPPPNMLKDSGTLDLEDHRILPPPPPWQVPTFAIVAVTKLVLMPMVRIKGHSSSFFLICSRPSYPFVFFTLLASGVLPADVAG